MSTTLTLKDMTNGNETTYTSITDGDTYSWRIDDSLDSGIIVFTNNNLTPVEPFTLATINFDDGSTEKMWVAEDSVLMLSKINNSNVYQHTLKLVELTKILEKILITGLCMTPTNKSSNEPMYSHLGSQFSLAVDKINLQTDYVKLKVTTNYDTMINQKEPETFVFNNSTAREILDEILSAIDSRVVVIDATYTSSNNINFLGVVELTIDFIQMVAGNGVALGTDTHHKLISESSSNSVESYAGEIYSNVESAVSDNEITMQDTFKSNDALATSNNRVMSLPYAIQYPTKFNLKAATSCSMRLKFSVTTGGGTTQWSMVFDLTNKWFDSLDYFVDYEYWVTLGTTQQHKTLYYQRGEAEVDVSRTYKSLIVTKSVIASLFHALIEKEFTDNFDYYKDQIQNSQYGQYGTVSNIFIDSYTTPTIDDIIFDISYIGEIEGLAVSSKVEDRTKFERDLKIVDGQRANVLDIGRYGRNLEGKIARVGNNLTYVDCDVDSYANILPLLTKLTDYDNGIIYQVDISRHTDSETWYEVRYYLSKNYNDLNERIALKKEKRIYAIPTKGYQVILPKRETVYIAPGNYTYHHYITTDMDGTPALIAKALSGRTNQITNAFVDVSLPLESTLYFTLPVTGYGTGNAINFITKFYDNASAGLSIDTSSYGGINWLGGKKVCYNKYTNDYGYAQSMTVGWGYYPNARTTAGVQAQPKRLTGGSAETITKYIEDIYVQQKDPSEAIGFQRIIKVIAGNNDTVVGCFCDLNCLIKDIGNVYLYYQSTDRDPYKPGDRKVRYNSSTDTKVNLSGLVTFELDNTYHDIIIANAYSLQNIDKYNMALGDDNGNMFIAFNGDYYGYKLFTVFKKEARG